MGRYLGLVQLEDTLTAAFVTRAGGVPVSAAALPGWRVYGPAGLLPGGTGTATVKDTGNVSGASNASPIIITSNNHGLSTGTVVTLAGVGGNVNANGTFTVTRVDVNRFSLDGTTGGGNYTSGGTWTVTGLYGLSIACTAAGGYASGTNYTVVVGASVNSAVWSDAFTFTVT
jgi:hypothetical protein